MALSEKVSIIMSTMGGEFPLNNWVLWSTILKLVFRNVPKHITLRQLREMVHFAYKEMNDYSI